MGSVPGLGGCPGGGHGNSLQYSSLENPMDRGAWRATVHGVLKSDTTEVTHAQTFSSSSNTVKCPENYGFCQVVDTVLGRDAVLGNRGKTNAAS